MNPERRLALAALGCAAMPRSLHARARSGKFRLGFLNPFSGPPDTSGPLIDSLRELGYVEGRNLAWEHRFAELRYERLPPLARELAALKPDLIATIGTAATIAAKQATATIPIVAIAAADPVGSGLAQTLARPGGNVTGVANVDGEATLKRIELLKALAPAARRCALFYNPGNPVHLLALPAMRPEIEALGVMVTTIPITSDEDIPVAFARIRNERIDSVCVPQEAFLTTRSRRFAGLALENKLPSIAGQSRSAKVGYLAGFGQNPDDSFRTCAQYIDRILNGARPGDLPFLRADKMSLGINLQTAATLSITVPQSILLRAEEVFR